MSDDRIKIPTICQDDPMLNIETQKCYPFGPGIRAPQPILQFKDTFDESRYSAWKTNLARKKKCR